MPTLPLPPWIMRPKPPTLLTVLVSLILAGCETGAGLGPGAGGDLTNAVSLAVGETAQFQGATARSICVTSGSPEEEFALITTSLAESGTTSLSVESENTSRVFGPPLPAPGPTGSPAAAGPGILETGLPYSGYGLHGRLRRLERTQLSERVSFGQDSPLNPGPRKLSLALQNRLPALGELMMLNTQSEAACEDPKFATGRVEVVSDRAIVVADTVNPPGGFGSSDYDHFAASFDTLIAPLAQEHFGIPADIDENERVIIFFTKDVNSLGSDDDETLTAGFFFSRDLFPTESSGPPLGSCASSNEAELLYLLVPDPDGVAGDPIDLDDVLRSTNVTIAHEYQHLINASRRLLGSASPRPFEEAWLNEAMSHAMEELLFYRATGLSPGMDIGIDDLDPEGVRAFNDFQRLNFFRFLEFLKDPGGNSPFDSDVGLATRGAAWSLLRYVADRGEGGDPAFLRALVDSPGTGLENLSGILGDMATVFEWLGDWSVGLYADNRVPAVEARFWDRSWDHFSLYESAGFSSPYIMTSDIGFNPLVVRALGAGGPGYFRFAVAEGELAQIRLRSGSKAPPSSLRATILRTN